MTTLEIPTCDVCGKPESVSRAAETASARLAGLPTAGREWLEKTYGRPLPITLCAACFIPALGGANEAAHMASQV